MFIFIIPLSLHSPLPSGINHLLPLSPGEGRGELINQDIYPFPYPLILAFSRREKECIFLPFYWSLITQGLTIHSLSLRERAGERG
jgi:hypothetical protein